MSGAGNALNQANMGFAGNALSVEQQYGFGADKSNPYSIARQLERKYAQQQAATGNSYARSGQLYAGSLSNARAYDRYESERELDEQIRAYQNRLAQIAQGGVDAATGYGDEVSDAAADWLEYGLEEPIEESEAFGTQLGGGGRGGGGGGGRGGGGRGGGGTGGGGGARRPPRPGPNFTWNARRGHWVRTAPVGSGGGSAGRRPSGSRPGPSGGRPSGGPSTGRPVTGGGAGNRPPRPGPNFAWNGTRWVRTAPAGSRR